MWSLLSAPTGGPEQEQDPEEERGRAEQDPEEQDPEEQEQRRAGERGTVLVAVLAGVMGLSAVAMGVALLATVDARVDGVAATRLQAQLAAESALELACAELAAEEDWSLVVAGVRRSAALASRDRPVVPGWGELDVGALTAALQRQTAARSVWRDNTGIWRPYLEGVPAERLSSDPPRIAPYVVVWVADDEAEVDDRPEQDSNGLLAVRADAYGSGGAHAAVVAAIRRRASGVQLVSWRAPD
jgi:hypothetical protein